MLKEGRVSGVGWREGLKLCKAKVGRGVLLCRTFSSTVAFTINKQKFEFEGFNLLKLNLTCSEYLASHWK